GRWPSGARGGNIGRDVQFQCRTRQRIARKATVSMSNPDTDPFALFQAWLAEAEAQEPNDPNAMALATADAQGRPSLRMVLLRGLDSRGLSFLTSFESRKGEQLLANPNAARWFHWKSLRRSVRVEGAAERVT